VRKLRNGFSVNCFSQYFNIGKNIALTQIEAFESEGYFEKSEHHAHDLYWNKTMKGCALSMASAAKKVKRTTADRHYHDFLGRVNKVNNNDEFLYQVSKVALFGSYLTNAETVSDIDLFIWLERKPKFNDDFQQVKEQRTLQMASEGRNFKNYGEVLYWPELDIRKYLKNSSRVISIQSNNDATVLIGSKVIFDIYGCL
jgi:predicted nucleotidyltransferase